MTLVRATARTVGERAAELGTAARNRGASLEEVRTSLMTQVHRAALPTPVGDPPFQPDPKEEHARINSPAQT
jgi:hypothetical protein